MKFVTPIMLAIAGIIHILPISGIIGQSRLELLYGISISDPNLLLLMRHRAVLFGILGVFLLYSTIRPQLQVVAIIAGLISVVSFLVLSFNYALLNSQISRVVTVDWIALFALLIAAATLIFSRKA